MKINYKIGSLAMLLLLSSCKQEPTIFSNKEGNIDGIEYQISQVKLEEDLIKFDIKLYNSNDSTKNVYLLDVNTPKGPASLDHLFWLGDVITCYPTELRPNQSKNEHFAFEYDGTGSVTLGKYLVTEQDLSNYDCKQIREMVEPK